MNELTAAEVKRIAEEMRESAQPWPALTVRRVLTWKRCDARIEDAGCKRRAKRIVGVIPYCEQHYQQIFVPETSES